MHRSNRTAVSRPVVVLFALAVVVTAGCGSRLDEAALAAAERPKVAAGPGTSQLAAPAAGSPSDATSAASAGGQDQAAASSAGTALAVRSAAGSAVAQPRAATGNSGT